MHTYAKLGQDELLMMVRWIRWHFPRDICFEIRGLAVWGRASYLSVTEAPQNTESLRVNGDESCFFETRILEQAVNPRGPTFQTRSFNYTLHQGPLPGLYTCIKYKDENIKHSKSQVTKFIMATRIDFTTIPRLNVFREKTFSLKAYIMHSFFIPH